MDTTDAPSIEQQQATCNPRKDDSNINNDSHSAYSIPSTQEVKQEASRTMAQRYAT
jgi:hypothetical protein